MARAPSRPRISEAAFQAQVLAFARRTGWLVHHSRPAQNRSGRYSTPISGDAGLPDLIMARRGSVAFLELKGDGGSIAAAQVAWARALLGMPDDWRPDRGRAYVSPLEGDGFLGYMLAYPDDFDALAAMLGSRWGPA